jgi:hypothetical protein
MSDSEKLDIFLEMEMADLRNKDFYASLTPELKKSFSPLVAMRWMSAVPDSSPYKDEVLMVVNEAVNVNFWDLREHPELQWKLMAASGCGVKLRHSWIPMAKRKKMGKINEFILQWYPGANDLELEIIKSGMNRDEFEQFVKSTGATDQELQEILKHYDTENGITPAKKPAGKKRKSTKV